jgi:hypothetical protein
MTPVKKMREVFVYEPILEKTSFSLLRYITICLEYELEVNCKNNQLQEISATKFCNKYGNFPFLPNGELGWDDFCQKINDTMMPLQKNLGKTQFVFLKL